MSKQIRPIIGTLIFFASLWIRDAVAVVVYDTTKNTVAPADDPGFNNVAIVNDFSGIYIGNRWMLTAAHVRVGDVTFPGIGTIEAVAESGIQLKNPTGIGLSEKTDLLLFKLKADPGLPTLSISDLSPSVGTEVLYVGNGRDRAEELTYWNVKRAPGKWTWTETDASGEFAGYKTIGQTAIRWGENIIEDDEPFEFDFDDDHTTSILTNQGDVVSLLTEFDNPAVDPLALHQPATENESHAVRGDSGGAMFHKNGEDWLLSGIVFGVSQFDDQPLPTLNAIFGTVTYSADLATYRDQIVSVYLNGDFDGDEELTALDLDAMTNAAINGNDDLAFDVDADGDLDIDDRAFWLHELKYTFFGDSNLDGSFNSTDLIEVFKAGLYEDIIPGNATWKTGDWNGDFEFDSKDLIKAFQDGAYDGGPLVAAVSVPESDGVEVVLACVLALTWLAEKRRR